MRLILASSCRLLMDPVREEDHMGAVCYRPTGELYLGNRPRADRQRGRIQRRPDRGLRLRGRLEENFFYADGRWASTAEYFEAVEGGPHTLRLKYEAAAVNLVMACPHMRLR